jgi:endonuclease/exonuclease/phosphatase family metal-dependent hydrolase
MFTVFARCFRSQKLALRNEEGVMILSKLPIVDYQIMLLPRAMTDPR